LLIFITSVLNNFKNYAAINSTTRNDLFFSAIRERSFRSSGDDLFPVSRFKTGPLMPMKSDSVEDGGGHGEGNEMEDRHGRDVQTSKIFKPPHV